MSRCISCGRDHEERPFLAIVTDRHRMLYATSRWEAPNPPVTTQRWDIDSWCRWIDGHGRWLE